MVDAVALMMTDDPNQTSQPTPEHAPVAGDFREELQQAHGELERGDFLRLQSMAKRIRERQEKQLPVDRMMATWQAQFNEAKQRWATRHSWTPHIQFPGELPISGRRDEIVGAIRDHQVLIVCGDTGSGKTTQLPKLAWLAGRGRAGRIGCTQPRRLAASSMARRVAEEMRCPLGHQVGYQVRFADHTTRETIIKFMTDGILLAETQADRSLRRYDALIIDEVHERSLNIDFILGYLNNLLPGRPDLKLILSSATLDAERFSRFFGNAPVITVEGRTYPIEDIYQPPHSDDEDLSRQVARAVEWIGDLDKKGDILVFLPGEREIHDAANVLRGRKLEHAEILPLYARLSMADQQRVFTVGGRRRIVLATNVAETSLTIPGIRYVVDSGLVRLSRYRPKRQIQSLQIEPVSQASARQRRGRCGRVSDGVCVRLYGEDELLAAAAYTDPEIRRTTLAGVILQMKVLGLPSIEEFPFIDPPSRQLIKQGYDTLFEIGALDKDNHLTPIGREIARFPVDPQLARMLVQARTDSVLSELIVIAAALNIQDPRERPMEQAAAADAAHAQWRDERSDFVTLLRLWNAWHEARHQEPSHSRQRKWCQKHFLNYRRMVEWQNLVLELADVTHELKWNVKIQDKVHDDCFHDRIHRAILTGFPMHVGMRGETMEYRGARGQAFFIFPGSGLFKSAPRWVVTFALVETVKLYARMVGTIDPAWVEQAVPHLCRKSHHDVHWSAEQGFVYAKETVRLGELTLLDDRRVHYGRIDPEESRKVFITDGLVPGNLRSPMPWLAAYREVLATVDRLEHKIRRPHALRHEGALRDHFERLVPAEIHSTKALDQWLLHHPQPFAPTLDEALVPQPTPLRVEDYPDALPVRGVAFALRYKYAPGERDDGVTLVCPQERIAYLPMYAADWIVPGWLPEKLGVLIRALPKDMTAACHPVQQTVDEFLAQLAANPVWREQSLLAVLSEFLRPRISAHVQPTDFDLGRVPEHLVVKVEIVDDEGQAMEFSRGRPRQRPVTSELHPDSTWIPAGWHRTGLTTWTEPSVLEPMTLPSAPKGLSAWPSLVDEGTSIGLRLFLDRDEAMQRHRAAVIRLFRLQATEVIERLERGLPVARATVSAISGLHHENGSVLDEFVELLLEELLCDSADGLPRTPSAFAKRADWVRGNLYNQAATRCAKLDAIFAQRDLVLQGLRALPGRMGESPAAADVRQQLAFLFRPGFIRWTDLWTRYPRYLQAMQIRLQRLAVDPRKDQNKWDPIRPFQQWQDAAVSALGHGSLPGDLQKFAALLQEYRIAQFAPELGTLEKVSPQRLQAAWPGTK
jgi:ATP-dependent helicase HrpA